MYCSECGAKVVDGSKFCSSCGKRLAVVPTSSEGMAGETVAVASKPKTEGKRPLWRKVLGDRERSALRCVLGIVMWVVILLVGEILMHWSTGFDYIDMRTSEYVAKYGCSGLSGAQWPAFWIGILLNVAGIAMVYCWLQALLSRIRLANRTKSIWAKVLAVAICFLFYCGFSLLRWYGNDCKPCWSMWDTFILIAVCTAVWRGLVGEGNRGEVSHCGHYKKNSVDGCIGIMVGWLSQYWVYSVLIVAGSVIFGLLWLVFSPVDHKSLAPADHRCQTLVTQRDQEDSRPFEFAGYRIGEHMDIDETFVEDKEFLKFNGGENPEWHRKDYYVKRQSILPTNEIEGMIGFSKMEISVDMNSKRTGQIFLSSESSEDKDAVGCAYKKNVETLLRKFGSVQEKEEEHGQAGRHLVACVTLDNNRRIDMRMILLDDTAMITLRCYDKRVKLTTHGTGRYYQNGEEMRF